MQYSSELGLKMKIELEERRQKLLGGHQLYVEYAQKGSDEKRTQQASLVIECHAISVI